MVFASLTFLYIFLPICLLLYFLVPGNRGKNIVLIFSSLIFYAWGEPIWISLLIFSASIDYLHGRIIDRYRGRWPSRVALVSSLVLNLGLLATFKYSSMIVESLNTLFSLEFPVPNFTLPIGISFYTFQTISYTIDVYRGQVGAQKSYASFLLFVSLFHQLVAGPIVRYKEIAKEILERKIDLDQIRVGIGRFLIGLAKKVLIANVAGEIATPFMENSFGLEQASILGAWYGAFLFGIQIYFDFSGYSDMAIGLGKIFGFNYGENFNHPYIARSASDFWRRWHISLGSFFRDYVYIPMGGNKKRVVLNILTVWFLTGLWHGASWNFVLWGLFYGFFIGLEKALKPQIKFQIPRVIGHLYLLFITLLGWVLFYFTDLSQMLNQFSLMFSLGSHPLINLRLTTSLQTNAVFLLVAVLFCLPLVRFKDAIRDWMAQRSHGLLKGGRFAYSLGKPVLELGLLAASTVLLVGSGFNPFLYFRF